MLSLTSQSYLQSDKEQIYDTIVSRAVGTCMRTQYENLFQDASYTGIRWSELDNFISDTALRNIQTVWLGYEELVEENSSMAHVMDYINDKIEVVLSRNHGGLTVTDSYELLAYTIIKHSHYYWDTK